MIVFGRPFVPDVMVVCGWRSGLLGCGPAGGGVVMGVSALLRAVGRYRSSVVAGWLLAAGWVLEGAGKSLSFFSSSVYFSMVVWPRGRGRSGWGYGVVVGVAPVGCG